MNKRELNKGKVIPEPVKTGKDLYPAPSNSILFKKHWNVFIEELYQKENFRPAHLFMLESLCDMYVEKKQLEDIIGLVGYTYDAGEGRSGLTIKQRPETQILGKVRAEIRNYHKALGLANKVSVEDVSKEEEKNEWG